MTAWLDEDDQKVEVAEALEICGFRTPSHSLAQTLPPTVKNVRPDPPPPEPFGGRRPDTGGDPGGPKSCGGHHRSVCRDLEDLGVDGQAISTLLPIREAGTG